jgi:mRNA interferase MazF
MVAGRTYVPDRGDLVWLDFNPQAGREQAGRRPALILSARAYNTASGLAMACPITSRVKGYPFEVPLPSGGRIGGVALADHLRCIDWRERHAQFAGRAPPDFVDLVAAYIHRLIDREN